LDFLTVPKGKKVTTATALSLATPTDVLRMIGAGKVFGIDLETTGLVPIKERIRLLSLSDGKRTLVMDCWEHPSGLKGVVDALNGSDKILVAHNARFDLGFLWHAGLTNPPETICTNLIARMLTAGEGNYEHAFGKSDLAACVLRWLPGEPLMDKELQTADWSQPLTEKHVEYAKRDSAILLPLLRTLNQKLTEANLHRATDLEMRAIRAFVWMAETGVPFDKEAWLLLAAKAAKRKQDLEARMEQLAPPRGEPGLFGAVESWNWNSPQQVKEVLSKLGFDVNTTADAQLAELPGEFPALLREHRSEAQLVKMYGQNWLSAATIVNGRVHPNWRQLGAASGRTACEGPNMQQIPRRTEKVEGKDVAVYRACVRATPGNVLVKADYATLQMRIGCNRAKDKALYDVFAGGGDPHTATAKALLGKSEVTKADRQIAKSANFGLLFGMSAPSLRIYSKMEWGVEMTEEEAERHHSKFFQIYPGLARWHREAQRSTAKETRTVAGRRRILPPNVPVTWRLNSPVQGDESDGLKLALALLWERRHKCPEAKPILAVHDEITLEVPESQADQAAKHLEECMMDGMTPWLDPVPVKVDVSIRHSWGG